MDASYTQGLIPGLPRHGGLAPHPVAMGMFAVTALLCLWCKPFANRWLNRTAWLLGLGVLFIAQSKTSWVAFLLCAISMLAVRNGPSAWRRLGDPSEGSFGVRLPVGHRTRPGAVVGAAAGRRGDRRRRLLETTQGAQLVSMTGRDLIWAIALDEWRANPCSATVRAYGTRRTATTSTCPTPRVPTTSSWTRWHARASWAPRPGALCPHPAGFIRALRQVHPGAQPRALPGAGTAFGQRSSARPARLWNGNLCARSPDHHAGLGRQRPRARRRVRATPNYRTAS